MRRILHDELYSPETALYRIEPDIKNGICTLRDCHRLLWAERVRVGLSSMNDLHARSYFTEAQTVQFCADYEFLIGLRSRLHRVYGRRIDILETSVQPDIAKLCGFGPEGAGALMERSSKRSVKSGSFCCRTSKRALPARTYGRTYASGSAPWRPRRESRCAKGCFSQPTSTSRPPLILSGY